MRTSRWLVLLAVISCGPAIEARAALFDFHVLYSGAGIAALAPGSDDPIATNLSAGDSFNYLLAADPGEYWAVHTSGSIFPFFSFYTQDSGTRTADFTLTLLLDGVQQLQVVQANITNSFAHIGTNTIDFTAGLQFDEILLNYDLLASTNSNNRPAALLPWPGKAPEEYSPQYLSYVDVPEPSSLVLLGLGLVVAGRVRRRRA